MKKRRQLQPPNPTAAPEMLLAARLAEGRHQPLPLAVIQAGGRVLQANPAAARLLGLAGGRGRDPIRQTILRTLDRNGRPLSAGRQPWSRAVRSGRAVRDAVIGLADPDGAHRWLQCVCLPTAANVVGRAPAALVILTDITRLHCHEEELAGQLRYEAALTTCVNQMLCGPRSCGHCAAMRHLLETPLTALPGLAAAHLFENTPDAAGARRIARFNRGGEPPGDPEALYLDWSGPGAGWARRLAAGKIVLASGRAGDRFGRTLLRQIGAAAVAVVPLFSGRHWLGCLAFAAPEAQRVWPPVQLRRLRTTARFAAGMVARKMFQERLLQTQKMETIGALAGGLAHDFNNILTGIRSSIQLLLLDRREQDGTYEDLEIIQQEIMRAADIARQLLSVSRPATGHSQPIDLNDQLLHLSRLFRRTLPKNIQIQLELAPDPLIARTDPTQFEQILLNLILNARDAMPAGGWLTIRSGPVDWETTTPAIPEARPGRYAGVVVEDSGPGIDVNALPRIFEPFFTTKSRGAGTGLGLSMVQAIVRHHHGYVTAHNRPEGGAAFTIYLPLCVKETPGHPMPAAGGGRERSPGGHETILVVDDEPPILKSTAAILSKYGYRVFTASSGAEAQRLIRRRRDEVALVLLDMAMPDMDGRECLVELRKIKPHLKAVLMSGYGFDRRAMPAAQAFLEKPFDINRLLVFIRQALDRD